MTDAAARYISTRGDTTPTTFADALLRGMAPDGGLYMPSAWPSLPAEAATPGQSYVQIAKAAMAPYIGDALPEGALDRHFVCGTFQMYFHSRLNILFNSIEAEKAITLINDLIIALEIILNPNTFLMLIPSANCKIRSLTRPQTHRKVPQK